MAPPGQLDLREIQQRPRSGKSKGFSLVELMVALVLGLVLLEGVLVLLSQTNRVNAAQAALAALQENGRNALQSIGADLRRAGHLPCGSRGRPMIYADALPSHIAGAPSIANAPAGWPSGTPYPLDRSIFISGNACAGARCVPALTPAQELPPIGLGAGERIPGTDVLTVRFLDGAGWAVQTSDAQNACDGHAESMSLVLTKLPGDRLPAAFDPTHAALVADCSTSEIFKPVVRGNELQPARGSFGVPACFATSAQTRVFDLDAQLQTVTYYLAMQPLGDRSGHSAPALMRRNNGLTRQLAAGIERLDFRYSLLDAAGAAHWLSAAQVDAAEAGDAAPLRCAGPGAAGVHTCTWSDINAVDVAMLVNTIEDLPPEASSHAWDYRYSVDGDAPRAPAAVMPVTGLPAGRMQRREFHSVVALRDMQP